MTKGINTKDWKPVAFGDMCSNLNESQSNPLANGIDRYVGLEHIETNNLHITSWGNVADGTTFTKRFRKGQVLFGKRRAYLRKAAIADFDGICSGDILVFEANEKVIDPKLLPFIVSSDKFFDYAVQTSAGSLSPRTKFQDLAKLKFLLPPKEQQAKLAELLWAADENIEGMEILKCKLKNTYSAFVKKYLKEPVFKTTELKEVDLPSTYQTKLVKGRIPKSWRIMRLKEVINDVQNGFAEGLRALDDGIIQLRMNNVTREGAIDLTDVIKVPNSKDYSKYVIEMDDVLFNNTNSDDLVGKSVIFENVSSEIVFSNHFTRLRCNADFVKQKFLYIWLKYHFEIGLFQRRCTKWVGQAAVQTENLLSLNMVIPTIKEQIIIIDKVSNIEKRIDTVNNSINNQKSIQKQLINQIFST